MNDGDSDDAGPLSAPQSMSNIPMGTPMAVEDHNAYQLPLPTEVHNGTNLGLMPRKKKHRA